MSKIFDYVDGNMDILMYDNTIKKIKDLKKGDLVYSVQYDGEIHQYVRSEITSVNKRRGKVKTDGEDVAAIVKNAVYSHHENWDGSGYPRKLKGDKIHRYARIIHVADVYDALTSKRVYKDSMNPADAIEYIMANSGSMFDDEVTNVFVKYVAPYPIGCRVLLSSGQQGTVLENNPDQLARPKIRLDNGTVIDLLKKLDITILQILNT